MRLGAYELLDELGRGGAGIVYRARSAAGRIVAVKLLLRASPDKLARFRREERLLAALGERQGFVPLLEVGETPHGPFLVMPFLEGGTLRARLKAGAFAVDEALELGRTLARTLARAHAAGIVHRDLKPENVLFSGDGRPFVADLGLARHFRADAPGASQSAAVTGEHDMLGTIGYMAPEQWADAHGVGPAADVFALGALLFEMLAGEPAFGGATAVEVFARTAQGDHAPLRKLRPEVPAWLATVVESALAADPRTRPEDAAALAHALEGAPAGKRRWPLLVAAGLVVAVVAAVAVSRRGPSPAPAAAPVRSTSPRPSPTPTPTPTPSPSPSPAADPLGLIAHTARTRLAAVHGTYAGKHGAFVHTVLLTPDGRFVVSSSMDGSLALWDVDTGREHAAYSIQRPLFGAASSPDGRYLVGSSDDGTIVVVDLVSQDVATAFKAHDGKVFSIAFVDDRVAWTAGADGTVRRFDILAGRELESHPWGELAALSRDKRSLLCANDRALALYDTTTGERRQLFEGHTGKITGCALDDEGKRAFSTADDGTLRIWDTSGVAAPRVVRAHDSRVTFVALAPGAKLAATTSFDGTAKLWDVATGELVRTIAGHASWVISCAFSPDGRRLFTASNDQSVRAWDVATGTPVWDSRGHAGRVTAVASLPGGERFVSGGFDRMLRLWDVATENESLRTAPLRTLIQALAVSPDGSIAAAAGGARVESGTAAEMAVWTLGAASDLKGVVASPTGVVRALAITPGTARIVSCGDAARGRSGELTLWRVKDASPEIEYHSPLPAPGSAVAVSPGGERIVVTWVGASEVRAMVALDLESEPPFEGLDATARTLAFSRDGKTLVAGLENGWILAWDVEHRRSPRRIGKHGAAVLSAVVAPTGELVTSSAERTIGLWDLGRGEPLDRIDLSSCRDTASSLALVSGGFVAGTTLGVILRFDLLPPR